MAHSRNSSSSGSSSASDPESSMQMPEPDYEESTVVEDFMAEDPNLTQDAEGATQNEAERTEV